MRVRRSVILVIAALAIWTFVSYELIGLSSGSHGCHLLVQVREGGSANSVIAPMTQAEMDARTAACSQPRVGDLFMPAAGYILIVGVAVASATGVSANQASTSRVSKLARLRSRTRVPAASDAEEEWRRRTGRPMMDEELERGGWRGRLISPVFPFGWAKQTVAGHLRHFLATLEAE